MRATRMTLDTMDGHDEASVKALVLVTRNGDHVMDKADVRDTETVTVTVEGKVMGRTGAKWKCWECGCVVAERWEDGLWYCRDCGGDEFFNPKQPTRHEDVDGTWVYVPHGPNGPPTTPEPDDRPQSETQSMRRRRRRRKHGGPPSNGDPPSYGERAESEAPTNDPTIEPSLRDGQGGRVNVPRGEPQRHQGVQERVGREPGK